jgi:hypothetical protein
MGRKSFRRQRYPAYISPEALNMLMQQLPTGLIVKALADAITHAQDVSKREHIKADRHVRVNQFVVSLRRHLRYMGDQYGAESSFLIQRLCRQEIWYDIGVLNKEHFRTYDHSDLPYERIEKWFVQAQSMIPADTSLNCEIEKGMQLLSGFILVAENCNQVTGVLNENADKLLGRMAALAGDL